MQGARRASFNLSFVESLKGPRIPRTLDGRPRGAVGGTRRGLDLRSAQTGLAWAEPGEFGEFGGGAKQRGAGESEPSSRSPGCLRMVLGTLLFYLNLFLDGAVYQSIQPPPGPVVVGAPQPPKLYGDMMLASWILQSIFAGWAGFERSRAAGLRGLFFLAPLYECFAIACCGAYKRNEDQNSAEARTRRAARREFGQAKYAELVLENILLGTLQLHTLMRFWRSWAEVGWRRGDERVSVSTGHVLIASVVFSFLSWVLTLASHLELFDQVTYTALAVEGYAVLGRVGVYAYAFFDAAINMTVLAALATAFRGGVLLFMLVAALARAALLSRWELQTDAEHRWPRCRCGFCYVVLGCLQSTMDVMTTERFGTKPLRSLMAWSFFK